MKIIKIILAIIFITAIGAAITCGGNIYLSSTGKFGDGLYEFWYKQIFTIFIFSSFVVLLWDSALLKPFKKYIKTIVIFIILLFIGLISFLL